MYGPVNLIKLLQIPNNLFLSFSVFSFLCKMWEDDVVSDFHGWGPKFGCLVC